MARGYKTASCQHCEVKGVVPTGWRGPFTCRECYADRFMASLERILKSCDKLERAIKQQSLSRTQKGKNGGQAETQGRTETRVLG